MEPRLLVDEKLGSHITGDKENNPAAAESFYGF